MVDGGRHRLAVLLTVAVDPDLCALYLPMFTRSPATSNTGRIPFLPRTKALHIRKNGRVGAIGTVRARSVHHMRTQCMGLHRGRTQHMSLSAPDVKNRCSKLHVVHKRIVPTMECDRICTRRPAQVQTK